MTPEEAKLDADLALLMAIHYEGMDETTRKNLTDSIADIKEEYNAAREIADQEKGDKDEKQYAKDVKEAIAKAVPNIMKGALSAASAFRKTPPDYLTGSAAILDLCASVIPVFTSVFSAAGPEGMVVGSIFSAIGQLLQFFVPAPPSVTSEVKKMLETLETEQELSAMKGIHSSISIYTSDLRETHQKITKLLKQPPLKNEIEANQFQTDLGALRVGVIDQQGQLNAAAFEQWKVGGWLRIKENQDKERWPEILGQWCQAYTDLMTANMMVNCMANPKKIRVLEALYSEKNVASPLSKEQRHDVLQAVIQDLAVILTFLRNKFNSWNAEALHVLNETTQAARTRGFYVHLGDNGYLYGANGQNAAWKSLDAFENYGARFTIAVPQNELNSFTPHYHIFACQRYSRYSVLIAGAVDVSLGVTGVANRGDYVDHSLSDVWALPMPKNEPGYDDKGFYVYLANDAGDKYGYVTLCKLDGANNWSRISWQPRSKAGMVNYRAVTHPKTPLPDDPDKDGLPEGSPLLGGVDHYNSIHYAAMRNSDEIYVNPYNEDPARYVKSPWPSYTGIEVDPYYIWVYRPYEVACATHASVIKCINGKSDKPRWMTSGVSYGDDLPSINGRAVYVVWGRYGDNTTVAPPPPRGLLSFCPSVDGTLQATVEKRIVTKDKDYQNVLFIIDHTVFSYTADYRINVAQGSLSLGPWVQREGVLSKWRKMPIPCWSMYESLKANLRTS